MSKSSESMKFYDWKMLTRMTLLWINKMISSLEDLNEYWQIHIFKFSRAGFWPAILERSKYSESCRKNLQHLSWIYRPFESLVQIRLTARREFVFFKRFYFDSSTTTLEWGFCGDWLSCRKWAWGGEGKGGSGRGGEICNVRMKLLNRKSSKFEYSQTTILGHKKKSWNYFLKKRLRQIITYKCVKQPTSSR